MRSAAALFVCFLVLLTLAACGGASTTPATVHLAADPMFADRAYAVAQSSLAPTKLSLEPAANIYTGDIFVSNVRSKKPDAKTFVRGYWVAAVQLPSTARDITMAD